jgi:hypothetical protein
VPAATRREVSAPTVSASQVAPEAQQLRPLAQQEPHRPTFRQDSSQAEQAAEAAAHPTLQQRQQAVQEQRQVAAAVAAAEATTPTRVLARQAHAEPASSSAGKGPSC